MKPCAPPSARWRFGVDMYTCPCGHLYGNHDAHWETDGPGMRLVIVKCNECGDGGRVAVRDLFDS